MREVKSFCRTCTGFCGVKVQIDGAGRVAQVRGDPEHPLSEGYACIKGVAAPEAHNSPLRLLRTMKRQPDGGFRPIPAEAALDEIAEKLEVLIAEDGVQTVSTYLGTMGGYEYLTYSLMMEWMRALGSHQLYTTFTIDQSAKWIAGERIGKWSAGRQTVEDSDVWMLIGGNPLVSVSQYGFVNNPAKSLRRARARGMKLIVIDPRRTETARHADVFLQPYPGEDPTVMAGLLRIVLSEGWQDHAFCAAHVDGVAELRAAVEPFDPAYVERRAGVAPDALRAAAKAFAHDGKRGVAWTSTGPSMAPRSNLTEHLVECLNVVCGRFLRVGDRIANPGVLSPRYPRRAHVSAPARSWERGPRTRVHGYGQLWGTFPTALFADQVLTPGEGRIRALFVGGGNPAAAVPDQRRIVGALRALDLLVTTDPVMSATAQLAHYVFAPTLQYERPATVPLFFGDGAFCTRPFASWTPAVAKPPEGAEVVDEWYVYWGLAKRFGLEILIAGAPLALDTPPSSEELFAAVLRHSALPFQEIKRRAGELIEVEPQYVEPGDPKRTGRFQLWPDDVAADLAEVASEPFDAGSVLTGGGRYGFRLISRRMREVANSMYKELDIVRRRVRYNPAFLHPDDLAELGLEAGAQVVIESDAGRIGAIVQPDAALRRGVVSMSHAWGSLPDDGADYEQVGANVNLLVSTQRNLEPINAMPRMSAIPVNIVAAGHVVGGKVGIAEGWTRAARRHGRSGQDATPDARLVVASTPGVDAP